MEYLIKDLKYSLCIRLMDFSNEHCSIFVFFNPHLPPFLVPKKVFVCHCDGARLIYFPETFLSAVIKSDLFYGSILIYCVTRQGPSSTFVSVKGQ